MTQTWSLNAASARRHLDCSLDGIRRGCGGRCCWSQGGVYWPANSSGTDDGCCPHLGPVGCRLGDSRPVTCHLYPFKLSPTNTLHVHIGALLFGCCHKNTRSKRTAWDSIWPSFVLLFGERQVERADRQIEAGIDPFFQVPDRIAERYFLEAEWGKRRIVPEPFEIPCETP